jgi:hypothetical protein
MNKQNLLMTWLYGLRSLCRPLREKKNKKNPVGCTYYKIFVVWHMTAFPILILETYKVKGVCSILTTLMLLISKIMFLMYVYIVHTFGSYFY